MATVKRAKVATSATLLKSSELRKLSTTERQAAVRRALRAVKPVSSGTRIKELRHDIAALEQRFSMSTAEMLERLCSGELPDEGTFAAWRKKYMILCAHRANARGLA